MYQLKYIVIRINASVAFYFYGVNELAATYGESYSHKASVHIWYTLMIEHFSIFWGNNWQLKLLNK